MAKVLQAPDFYANEYAPAHRSNYTAGRLGESIDKIVVHVTQGSFASAYNWCQRPEANVSWHYLLAQNGYTVQQLSEAFMGWHAGNLEFNKTSVGIEHAGYISDSSMWTEAMYRNSAKIAAGIIHRAPGIPNDRFGYHLWAHSSIPGSTHTDPGRYFDWDKYMALIAEFLGGSKAENPPVQSEVWRGTRWDWCQDDLAPCPAVLMWDGKDVWRVERVSSNPERLPTMTRWEFCQDDTPPAPVVLTWDGGSAWKVTRI